MRRDIWDLLFTHYARPHTKILTVPALTETALNAEMDHHLAGDEGAGNTRNGYSRKPVMTDTGKLSIDVPRDRQALRAAADRQVPAALSRLR